MISNFKKAQPFWVSIPIFLFWVEGGFAEGPTNALLAKKKQTIYVGVYVNQITNVSLKNNSLETDFVVWFRGHTEGFDPVETFDLVDGQIKSKTEIVKTELPGGVKYASCRVIAQISKSWNLSRFPRDGHTIRIAIEDGVNEDYRVRYAADTENCGSNPYLKVPGWVMGTPTGAIEHHQYHTNYGDTSLPTGNTSNYSQFVYSIPLARRNWGYFVKLLFGLFVSSGITFLTFFIRPGDAKFTLGVGSIFAAVASQYINASHLPEVDVMTMADMLHLVAFLFIFMSMAESTLSIYYFQAGHNQFARRVDRFSFFLLGGIYLGLSVWIVLGWG